MVRKKKQNQSLASASDLAPKIEAPKTEEAPTTTGGTNTFRDDKGNVTGITLEDGKTYFADPASLRELVQQQNQKKIDAANDPLLQFQKEQNLKDVQDLTGQELEAQGAFKPQQEARDLTPDISPIEGITPGGEGSATLQATRAAGMLSIIDPKKLKDASYEDFINNPEIKNNPFYREAIRNDLDLAIIASGEVRITALDITIEALPAGGAISKWLITSTAIGKFGSINKELEKLETEITAEKEAATYSNPDSILSNVVDYEDRINWLEGKIRLLGIQSATLKNAPEELDVTQRRIEKIYGLIEDVRVKSAQAKINNVEADAETTYLAYKRYKDKTK